MLRRHDLVCSDPEHPEQAGEGLGCRRHNTWQNTNRCSAWMVPIKMPPPWAMAAGPQHALRVQAPLDQVGVADRLTMLPAPLLSSPPF